MYFLHYRVIPAKANPERDCLGEGLVCCWIERPSLAEADRVARREIRGRKWQILERETAEQVTAEDYAEDLEWQQYYEQALLDKEVFLYHVSPRFPVYWVSAIVEQGSPV